MLSLRLIVLCTGLALPIAAGAQNRQETLADIRQELSVLWVEIQRLRTLPKVEFLEPAARRDQDDA